MNRHFSSKPRPLSFSLSRLTSVLAVAAALAGAETSKAQSLNWDPNLTGTAGGGGAGTWDLTTANWFDGVLDVAWPNLTTNVGIFGTTGGIVTIDTAGDTGVIANGLTFNVTGYRILGAIGAEVLTLAGTTPTVTVNGLGVDAEINAVIAGTAGLAKSGTGRLVLTGANTFTGGVSLLGGITTISADNNLGDVSNGLTIDGGTLNVDTSFSSARTVTLGGGGGTVDTTLGTNLTLSSALAANANALTKSNSGTLTLQAASTRSGVTQINGGTITATNLGALGTGAITAGAGGTMEFNTAAGTMANNIVLDGGTLLHTQTGTLTVGAANTINVTSNGGTVSITAAAPGGKILLNTAGQLTGSGVLTKTGAGDLQLSVANTGFTGTATVNGGILEVQNAQALGTTAPIVTVGGTGELVTTNVPWSALIIANTGGAISGNGAATVSYSSPITANGQFGARARHFQTPATATTMTLSGQITGAGGLIASGPTAGTGRVLITGDNGGTWTGALQVNPNTQAVASVGFGTGATTSLPSGDLTLNGGRLTITPSIGTGLTTTSGISGRWITTGNAAINATYITPWFTVPTAATRTDASINFPTLATIDPATGLPGSQLGASPLPQGVGIGVNGVQVDRYAVIYNGLLNITTGGAYTFFLPSDDGAALFIDGQQVIQNDGSLTDGTVGHGLAGGGATSAAVTLTSGAHQITIKQTNGGTGGGVQFAYQGPDQPTAPTPVGLNPITNMGTVAVTALTNVTGGLTYNLANNIVVPNQGAATSTILETSGFDTNHTGTINVGTNGNLVFASATSHAFTSSGAITLAAGSGLSSSSVPGVTVPIATVLTPANVTLNGNITLNGNANLNATGGPVVAPATGPSTNSPGLLTVNGVIDDGAGTFGLTMNAAGGVGGGTVVLGGTSANTFEGAFTVKQGLLLLNKSAGVNAIGTGGLSVDATGFAAPPAATAGVDVAVARLMANEQIADTAPLTVSSHLTQSYGATFDMNGFTETVGSLSVIGGSGNMGRVVMGVNGELIVNGNISMSGQRNATGNTGREALITGVASATSATNLFQPGTGILNLGGAARTVTVTAGAINQANTDGTIDSRITNGSIIKAGGQRLTLNGSDPANGRNSTFAGGVTFNDGVLRLGGMGAQTDSVLGTGALTINKGLTTANLGIAAGLPVIEYRNNGAGVNTAQGGTVGGVSLGQAVANTVTFGNAVNIAASVPITGFDVNNYVQLQNGATLTGSGATMVMGTLTTNAAAQINVTGGNNYALRFNGLALGGALTILPTTGNLQLNDLATAGANNITSAVGTTGSLIIGGSGTGYTGTINLTNGGTLRLAPAVGVANNQLGGATLTVAPTLLGISPTAEGGAISGTGAVAGGLTAKFYQTNAAQVINTSTAYYSVPSGVITLPFLSDGAFTNRPPTVTGTSFTNDIMVASGLLNITTAGAYTFQTFVDDESQLVIDGIPVVSVNTGAGGTGLIHSPVSAPITLSAGFHTISFKVSNQGGGGGFGVLYSGADSGSVMRPIPSAALYRAGSFANVANSGVNQTIGAGTFTLDGGGTDLDGGINDLTFTGAGTLAVTNGASTVAAPNGTGVITVSGTTSFGANNITLSPSTAVLGMLGDVTGTGSITKTGAGLLILSGAKTFTGQLNVNVGGVQVTDPASLGTVAGSTVVASGAVLDLNGVALGAEPLSLNGTGIANVTPAALWNSASTAASASGPITLAAATTIGGLGDMSLTGAITGAFNLTKVGPNTLTVTNANNTGTIPVTQGFLKLGGAGAVGANVTNVLMSGGAVLDLNGQSMARPINLTGAGTTNYGTMNSLGSLINTGAGGVTVSNNVVLGGAASLGSSSLAAGGDYTISGIISAAQALTKVGGNTVTFTGVNTYSGATTVNSGTLTVSGAGIISAQGSLTVNPTATVNYDYTAATTAKNGAHAITLVGGNLNLTGNAANTTEALGANSITTSSNQSVITLTPSATGSLTLSSTNNLARANNGTILIRGTGLGNATGANVAQATFGGSAQVVGQFGADGSKNRGIVPWAFVGQSTASDGDSFAKMGTNGAMVLNAASEYDVDAITGPNNILAATTNVAAPAGSTLINSITMTGAGTMTIGAGNSLQLDSGGIGANATTSISGAGTLNAGITQSNNLRETIVYTSGAGTNLTVSATLASNIAGLNAVGPNANPNIGGLGGAIVRGGLTKAGLGTLTLSGPVTNFGTTRLNGGTTVLNGGTNTILFPTMSAPVAGNLASSFNAANLVVNAGATLDLNGNAQRFGGYASNLTAGSSALPGQGGVITNNSTTSDATIYFSQGATFTVPSSINQSAVIGAMKTNVVRDGGNTLTLTAPNTYTGTTVLNGGLTVLQDGATLSGTSSITINRAVLRIDDAQTIQTLNRIPAATPITLNGGALAFVGRGGGTQNVWNVGQGAGAITIGLGNALLQTTMSGSANANSAGNAQVNIGNLVRGGVGSQVSFNFVQQNAQSVGDNPRYFISQLNGGALPAPGVMLPAWITVGGHNPASAAGGTSGTINNIAANTTDFAQYDPATGLRALLYTSTLAPGNNVNLGATTTLPAGNTVINSLRLDGASTLIFGNAGYDTLNLQSGGFLSPLNANNRSIGTAANAGNITAGGLTPAAATELFIYNGQNTLTVNARIIDNPNGGGSVITPVFSSGGFGATITLTGSNTYTGTTYVNGVNLTLNNTVGGLTIPGNLIVSGNTSNGGDSQSAGNQTVSLSASNQIAPTATVTLNGGTLLSLGSSSQTLANLVFQADGGSNNNQGPGVQTGTGVLTLTGGITATNLLQATTIPVMQGNLALPAGSHTINVGNFLAAPTQIGFALNSALSGSGSIDKSGPGKLGLGGTSPGYTGIINVNAGSLAFTTNLTSVPNAEVALAASTTLDAGGLTGTVGKLSGTGTVTSTFNGVAQYGGQVSIGADNGGSSFGGLVTGAVAIAKVGTGNFFLSNNTNDYTGGTLVNGGTLTLLGLNTTGSGGISVNNTGTLAGSGAVDGGLRFNPGSAASFVLPGSPGPALITTGGTAVSTGASTLNFSGSPGVGQYPLIDYSGTPLTANQMAGFKVGTTPGGGLLYGLVNNAAGTSIDLSVETVHASQTWTGGVNGTWDIGTTPNFGGTYTDTNQVIFNDSGANKNISGPAVNPQAITVNNSIGNDYTIGNAIGGSLAGGLTKSGNGTLRLTGANTFGDSPIAVNGGTLRASVTSTTNSLGSALVALANGTTLQLDPTANTSTTGITGRYFHQPSNNNNLANMHFQLAAVTTQTDPGVPNVTWNPGNRPANALVGTINGGSWESFAAQWVGKLNVTAAGPYSLFTNSDDATRVFIDGVQINNNDGGKGNLETGATAFLGIGLHDVRFEFLQGTGGAQAGLSWQGPGIAKANIPAGSLFTAENVAGGFADNNINIGTNVSVSGTATLALNGANFTAVQLGGLTIPGGSTLNVTGNAGKQLRAGGTFLSGGTATINSTVDVNPGLFTDGGAATTLIKQGTGRLVLDNTSPVPTGQANVLSAGTVIEMQGGKLALIGQNATALPLNSTNPLGLASIRLNGGGLSLETKQGTVTFDNAITVSQSATIEQQAASGLTMTLGSGSNGIAVSGGSTLGFDLFGGTRGTTNPGAQNANQLTAGASLTVAGAITGSGNLTFRSTQTNLGQYPVYGSATLTANNTIAGTTTLNGGYASQNVTNPLIVTLNGQGRLSASTGITLNAAQLTVDDSGTVTSGRILSGTPLTLRAGSFVMNTNGAASETLGNLTLDAGWNRVIETGATAASVTGLITANSLVRNNRSAVQFQASSLGGAATNSNLVKFTTVPALTGGGGAAGSATISILPYAVGASNPGTNPPTFYPVTYDATNGIRPINAAGETVTFGGAAAGVNARSTNSANFTTTGTTNAVNSYVIDNSANAAITGTYDTNAVNISNLAGLLMFTATNATQSAITINGSSPGFQFGAVEGNIIVTNTAGATIGIPILGSNGITISGNNNINTNSLQQLSGGSLTLTANNSAGLTGTITINGRLVLNNGTGDTPLGNAANPVQFGGGTLVFNNAGSTLAATRTVTMLPNTFGVIDTNGNANTIAGPITGTGGLVKVGGGTLTLSNAASDYSGTTTVFQGNLVTTSGPQGNLVLANISNVNFTQAASGTYAGNISGIGSVTVNLTTPGQTLTLGNPANASVGVNTYGGGTTIASASTTLRGTTTSLVGGIATGVVSNIVTYDQSFDGTASTVITGAGSVIKQGTGKVTLINSSAYTGSTSITAGILNINSDANLGASTGALSISNNATLQAAADITTNRPTTLGTGGGTIDTNGNTVTFDNASSITGAAGIALTKVGSGILDIEGTQTYSILNTNAGATILDSTLGTGTSTINANGGVTQTTVSQTLSALNIADGATVIVGSGPLPAPLALGSEEAGGPGALGSSILDPSPSSGDFGSGLETGVAAAAVPEPGSIGLFMAGVLGVLGRRRRRS